MVARSQVLIAVVGLLTVVFFTTWTNLELEKVRIAKEFSLTEEKCALEPLNTGCVAVERIDDLYAASIVKLVALALMALAVYSMESAFSPVSPRGFATYFLGLAVFSASAEVFILGFDFGKIGAFLAILVAGIVFYAHPRRWKEIKKAL